MANEHTHIQACVIQPRAQTLNIALDRPFPLAVRSPVTWQIEAEDPFTF
jgi:hypothetical protein